MLAFIYLFFHQNQFINEYARNKKKPVKGRKDFLVIC